MTTAGVALGRVFNRDMLYDLFEPIPEPTTIEEAKALLRNKDVKSGDSSPTDAVYSFSRNGAISALYTADAAYELDEGVLNATLAHLRDLVWQHVVNLRQVDAHNRADELIRAAAEEPVDA